jgi:Ser/Thr protein kinase RdoA (MazF antagonist)
VLSAARFSSTICGSFWSGRIFRRRCGKFGSIAAGLAKSGRGPSVREVGLLLDRWSWDRIFMLSAEIEAWLLRQGWGDARPEPVAGGTNNSVYRVRGAQGSALLKISKPKSHDQRDRFGAEKDFYDLLEERGLRAAPRRHAFDELLGVAIYEWIDGAPVERSIGREDLADAMDFLLSVQTSNGGGIQRVASEACFSWSEHRSLIESRIRTVRTVSEEVANFVREELVPLWEEVASNLDRVKAADFSSNGGQRILSPGDFGFHNALRRPDGGIVFFDFEYSGWDDPAKTVADIFLQPEQPVSFAHWDAFCEELRERAVLDRGFPERASALLPLFGVKWACILLNALNKRPSQGVEQIEGQIKKCREVSGRTSAFSSLTR